MRYIGGKALLLDKISDVIDENIGWDKVSSVIDIFSGSGIVSEFFKNKSKKVFSNDNMYFSYVLSRGTTGLNVLPYFSNIKGDALENLNNLDFEKAGIRKEDCFIYSNYSPNENSERMYFQNENALKIDIIRQTIEKWYRDCLIDDDGYYYLLASLINAVPYVANITGTFGAYLKFWDKRKYNKLTLKAPDIISKGECTCSNEDFSVLLDKKADLLYADPPYNSREYLPNYHILETIARYDNPKIHGVTGMREYDSQKSPFCKKSEVHRAFEKLIGEAKSRYILISYNNEGIISTKDLAEICKTYAVDNSFRLYEFSYRRYKNKIPNNTEGLKEQLYFLRRH